MLKKLEDIITIKKIEVANNKQLAPEIQTLGGSQVQELIHIPGYLIQISMEDKSKISTTQNYTIQNIPINLIEQKHIDTTTDLIHVTLKNNNSILSLLDNTIL